VTFDNAGVGGSTGTTPSTIAQMARDALAFLETLQLGAVDLLGFSIGSFVAQEIALTRPDVVRRLVLASSAPRGAPGMHGWAPEVIEAVGAPERSPDGYLGVFFTRSAASRQAGVETLRRLTARRDDRDKQTTWQTRRAQYDAVCEWGIPDHGQLQRVSAIRMPVFVANGDSDPMILPHFSHLLAGLIPQARVKIFLPGRGARVPVPAARRVRPRRQRVPRGVTTRPVHGGARHVDAARRVRRARTARLHRRRRAVARRRERTDARFAARRTRAPGAFRSRLRPRNSN
jgi:pimeloyl-ACP methyl ester carboxylesterase